MDPMLIVGIVVLVLIVALVAFIATRPPEFRVERSADIAAPPDVVFPLINNLRNWEQWSPWEKLDPGMKRTFSDNADGEGATYAWEGNKKVGQGRMTITESRPNERIETLVEFLKPFKATNSSAFDLKPVSGGTRVTWSMWGKNTLMGKVMCLFMNMDRMIGKDFEKGLGDLKGAAEGEGRSG